jgi:hypothetical protein
VNEKLISKTMIIYYYFRNTSQVPAALNVGKRGGGGDGDDSQIMADSDSDMEDLDELANGGGSVSPSEGQEERIDEENGGEEGRREEEGQNTLELRREECTVGGGNNGGIGMGIESKKLAKISKINLNYSDLLNLIQPASNPTESIGQTMPKTVDHQKSSLPPSFHLQSAPPPQLPLGFPFGQNVGNPPINPVQLQLFLLMQSAAQQAFLNQIQQSQQNHQNEVTIKMVLNKIISFLRL